MRTVTEAQNLGGGGLLRGTSLVRTTTAFNSGARAALADKLDELEQLRDEIRQRCGISLARFFGLTFLLTLWLILQTCVSAGTRPMR